MITAFTTYIKSIAILIIFSVFVEMALPGTQYKKYVQLVFGFLMILVVLKPFHSVLANFSLDDSLFQHEINLEKSYLETGVNEEELLYRQSQLIMETYKQNLADQLKEALNKEFGGDMLIVSVAVSVNENKNSEQYAAVESVLVKIGQKDAVSPKDDMIQDIIIDPVRIDEFAEPAVEDAQDFSQKEIEIFIQDFYKLQKDNIHIIVQKN